MFGKGAGFKGTISRLFLRIKRLTKWGQPKGVAGLYYKGVGRLKKAEKRLLSVSALTAIFSVGLIFTYSNCGQITFNGGTAKSNTGGPITPESCSVVGQNRDAFSGLCACPTGQEVVDGICSTPAECKTTTDTETGACTTSGSTGFSTRQRTTTRTLNLTTNQCTESVSYSDWEYSQCHCPATGQVISVSTGVCSCPTGQSVVNGTCQNVTCTGPKPDPIRVYKPCPTGVGQMYVVGPEATCPAGSTTWSGPVPPTIDDNTHWITTGCGCPAVGQVLNQATLACECPMGQVVSGGQCKTVVCTKDDEETETTACGGGATGSMTRKIPLTCGQDGVVVIRGTPGPWDKSGCVCSGGRTFNTISNACACPTGQTYDGTSCKANPCLNPQNTIEDKSCGSGASGTARRTREETCPAPGSNFQYGPWTPFDYSGCSCSDVNAQFNPSLGCQCKADFAKDSSGRCKPIVCSWSGDKTVEQTDPALPCGYKKRKETCSQNGTSLVEGPWLGRDGLPIASGGFDYSGCSVACPLPGQIHSRNSPDISDCSCPSPTYEVNGRCGTCANDKIYNLTTKTCTTCNPGDVQPCVGEDPNGVYQKTCSATGDWLECRPTGCRAGYQTAWEFEVCTKAGPLENKIEVIPGATCADAKNSYKKYMNVNWRFCAPGCERSYCEPIPVAPPTPVPTVVPDNECVLNPNSDACIAPGPGANGGGPGGNY